MVKPASIYVGESLTFEIPDSGLASVKVLVRGAANINLDASLDGGKWVKSVEDTSAWRAGECRYEIWGDSASGRKLLEAGRIEVLASIASAEEGSDLRSLARRNVEALEAHLSGIADPDSDRSVARYKINNRELENYSIADIRALLDYWRGRLAAETRKEAGMSGRGGRIVFHV